MIEEALTVEPQSAALNHANWRYDGGGAFTITVGDTSLSRSIRPKVVVNAARRVGR